MLHVKSSIEFSESTTASRHLLHWDRV